jgi:hypothetical protein
MKVLDLWQANGRRIVDSEWLERASCPWACKDEEEKLEGFKKSGKAFVCNLDDKDDPRGGTHWTAGRFVDGRLYYADPFGSNKAGFPPKFLASLSEGNPVVNSLDLQNPSSALCGYFAQLFTGALDELRPGATRKEMEQKLLKAIQ